MPAERARNAAPFIRAALHAALPGFLVETLPSSRGAMLLRFETPEDCAAAAARSPFHLPNGSVVLEPSADTDNRFVREARVVAHVAAIDFPLEHWFASNIRAAFRGFGTVTEIDPACLTGFDYSSLRFLVKVCSLEDIPPAVWVLSPGGHGAVVKLTVLVSWDRSLQVGAYGERLHPILCSAGTSTTVDRRQQSFLVLAIWPTLPYCTSHEQCRKHHLAANTTTRNTAHAAPAVAPDQQNTYTTVLAILANMHPDVNLVPLPLLHPLILPDTALPQELVPGTAATVAEPFAEPPLELPPMNLAPLQDTFQPALGDGSPLAEIFRDLRASTPALSDAATQAPDAPMLAAEESESERAPSRDNVSVRTGRANTTTPAAPGRAREPSEFIDMTSKATSLRALKDSLAGCSKDLQQQVIGHKLIGRKKKPVQPAELRRLAAAVVLYTAAKKGLYRATSARE